MKYKIASRHLSIADALEASSIDLSYNPQEALAKAKSIDNERTFKRGAVFLMENGQIWYVLGCDISLLNRFEPFYSILDDAPFQPVKIEGDTIEIFSDIRLPRDRAARKTIANCGLMVTTMTEQPGKINENDGSHTENYRRLFQS